MMAWVLWSLFFIALTTACAWGNQWAQSERLDNLRRVDPAAAAAIEQVQNSGSRASLPMRIRGFEKPRHPDHF